MGLVSGKCVVLTVIMDVPIGMTDEQAAQLPGNVSFGLPVTSLIRGSFMEMKQEDGLTVANRFQQRLAAQAGKGPIQ